MRLLLDTNVLLDCYEKREPFYQDWKRLHTMCLHGYVELWASAKSFTDIFYVARKQIGSVEIQRAFANSLAFLDVCAIDGDDVLRATEACWPDFEDCLIYQAARKVKADFIITRNERDFARSSVPVLSPAGFIIYMRDELHLDCTGIEL